MKIIKKTVFLAIVVSVFLYDYVKEQDVSKATSPKDTLVFEDTLLSAFKNKKNNLQVRGKGVVIKQLADDLEGSRHQKFIIKLNTGQTLVMAHNIDLAAKINDLRKGDEIEFYGEYEYNSRGGIIHWTHHDPDGYHIAGWIKHIGKTYQ